MIPSLFLTAGNTVDSFNTAISVVLSTGAGPLGLHRKLALKVGVGGLTLMFHKIKSITVMYENTH